MVFPALSSRQLPAPFAGAVNRILKLDELEELYTRVRSEKPLAGELLKELDVRVSVTPCDVKRVPLTGAVIAISNHPFGLLDGVILADLLARLRPDVRILTNNMLAGVPELTRTCIFVDPFERPASAAANGRALREAFTHVRRGGLLLIFPAGEVSHFHPKGGAVRDPRWRTAVAGLARRTGARIVPIHICGCNRLPFHLLGMVHPRLRTAALPGEFLNKRGHTVEVRIGGLVEPGRLRQFATDAETVDYLRQRSEWLALRAPTKPEVHWSGALALTQPEASTHDLAGEIESLPDLCRLGHAGDLDVFIAEAARIPNLLREIGRLRELTFRAVGEGTGNERDLDHFDNYYLHLFVWNRSKREIVGAYRVGDVPQILLRFGVRGLYTNTQFEFQDGFFRRLGPSLELGRSFVRAEYQRQFMPLALLWRGICAWIVRRPEYSTLIGAVSISGQYSRSSRELIAAYFEHRRTAGEIGTVKPRKALRGRSVPGVMPGGMEDLSDWVSEVEPDRKGLPILVKQYVKLGGRILAFSVDPAFRNTLDGFVVLDLRSSPRESLERHMGKDTAADFLAWHGAGRTRAA